MINYTFHWGYTFQWSKNSRNWLFPSYACLYAQILATNLQTTRSNQQAPQIFETCVHVQTFWVIWWIMLLSQFQRSCSTSCFPRVADPSSLYRKRVKITEDTNKILQIIPSGIISIYIQYMYKRTLHISSPTKLLKARKLDDFSQPAAWKFISI